MADYEHEYSELDRAVRRVTQQYEDAIATLQAGIREREEAAVFDFLQWLSAQNAIISRWNEAFGKYAPQGEGHLFEEWKAQRDG